MDVFDRVWAGEASEISGVPLRVVQDYTSRGLVQPPSSTGEKGGRNLYGRVELVQLAFAKDLASKGFSLDELGHFLSNMREEVAREPVFWLEDDMRWKELEQPPISLELLLFDPFPQTDHMAQMLSSVHMGAPKPSGEEGWVEHWESIVLLVPVAPFISAEEVLALLWPRDRSRSKIKDEARKAVNTKIGWEKFMTPLEKHLQGDARFPATFVVAELARYRAQVGRRFLQHLDHTEGTKSKSDSAQDGKER